MAPNKYRQALLASGGMIDVLDLPAAGMTGNSHMQMMDRNSDQIASQIQAWMVEKGLTK